jgi:hypothetical protein
MRIERRISLLILALCLSTLPALAGGDVNLFVGQREMSEDRFDEVGLGSPPQLGVSLNLEFDWPVALALDLFTATDDSTRYESGPLLYQTDLDVLEFDLGVRKLFGAKRFKPYVGGGLGWVQLEIEQIESGSLGGGSGFTDTILDDSDSSFGFWIDAGFLYRVGGHFNVGIDLRYSNADAELIPASGGTGLAIDSGGLQYGVVLGYHW